MVYWIIANALCSQDPNTMPKAVSGRRDAVEPQALSSSMGRNELTRQRIASPSVAAENR